jgi:hypothetical protein
MGVTDDVNASLGDLKQAALGIAANPLSIRGWMNIIVVGLVFVGIVMVLKKVPFVGKIARRVPGVK